VSGLPAAQALVNDLETRDRPRARGIALHRSARPELPQEKQAHALLGGAIKALEELFPGFAQDLVQAGAVAFDPGFEVLQGHPGPSGTGSASMAKTCSTHFRNKPAMRVFYL
jgi:hypothetical protein